MQQGFFRAQIVAIYEDHLLKGSRFLRPLRLTEQMCHPSGESELERQLHVLRSVELGDGSEVRETANLSDPGTVKTFLRGGTKRSCHFEVKESAGKQVRFTVRSTEANGVHAALYRVLGDRYFIRPEKTGGCGAYAIMFFWCLLGLIGLPIVVFFLMSLTYRGPGSEIFAFIVWLLSFALMIWGGLHILFARRGPWSKATELPTLAKGERPKERKPVEHASRPLHNPVAGWFLKILGLAYFIVIASPLTDGLAEYMDQALKNNSYQKSLAWIPDTAPAPLMIYNGYRMCLRRYDPKQSHDTRKPILFLRPFEDDAATSLQPPGILSAITGVRGPSSLNGSWSSASEGGRITATDIMSISHPARLLRMVLDIGAGSSEETIAR